MNVCIQVLHDIQGIKYIACYVKRLKLFGFLDKQEALARGASSDITMQKSVGVKSGYAE